MRVCISLGTPHAAGGTTSTYTTAQTSVPQPEARARYESSHDLPRHRPDPKLWTSLARWDPGQQSCKQLKGEADGGAILVLCPNCTSPTTPKPTAC